MMSSFSGGNAGLSLPAQSDMPKKILCVGIICLDIVQTCRQFPLEDSIGSSMDYRWQRGGNASNTCTVLSLLRQPCELLASSSAGEHGSFLQNDLCKYEIDYYHCPIMPIDIGCPISTIILSLSTGSRTIIHHKANLPELTLKDFEALNLEEYSWIHFEGRNLDEVLPMIRRVKNYNSLLNSTHDRSTKSHTPITISVELERPRSELLELLLHADVAFIAKDFAKSQGFNNMSEVIKHIGQNAKSSVSIICPWAEEGAMARTVDGIIVHSPAFPPQEVIDTLGAGDTFNAAVLYYLNKRKAEFIDKYKEAVARTNDVNQVKDEFNNSATVGPDVKKSFHVENLDYSRVKLIDETILKKAITFACHVAGAKIGLRGYDGLDKVCVDILSNASVD